MKRLQEILGVGPKPAPADDEPLAAANDEPEAAADMPPTAEQEQQALADELFAPDVWDNTDTPDYAKPRRMR